MTVSYAGPVYINETITAADYIYPACEPFETGHVKVTDGHKIYFERFGKKGGKPAFYVHGGPGSGLSRNGPRYFKPDVYDVVVYDQRGCGKSVPLGDIEHNTTQDLIADLEHLRTHFGFDKMWLAGGSWGSALILAFAQTYPQHVAALIPVSTFLTDAWMVDWWKNPLGLSAIWPEALAGFSAHYTTEGLLETFLAADNVGQRKMAHEIIKCHGMGMTLLAQSFEPPQTDEDWTGFINGTKVFLHYMAHDYFLNESQLLKNADKLAGIRTHIIHGRYDLCCPIKAAFDLHVAMPHAELTIVPDAAHRTVDAGLAKAIVAATDAYAAS